MAKKLVRQISITPAYSDEIEWLRETIATWKL